MLSRSVELIGLVPARLLVACERIAFKTSGCLVFKEVLPASILDSCKVKTSRRPASADFTVAPEIAVVKLSVFQGWSRNTCPSSATLRNGRFNIHGRSTELAG